MKKLIGFALAVVLIQVTAVLAEPSALPGDRGRPNDGIFPVSVNRPASDAPRRVVTPAPALPIDVALKLATAISDACDQFPLGVAVTDSEGVAKLIYVPDRSAAWHGYSAVRKAYTAITFAANTSELVKKAQEDPEFAAKVKADPNLQAYSGGLLLKSGGAIVGAVGVSGAEPGGHDEECGLKGLEAIRDSLD